MIRQILTYPNVTLTKASEWVAEEEFGTDELKQLLTDMKDTMYAHRGMGLAAPQIGVLKSIFIVDIEGNNENRQAKVFINPVLSEEEDVEIVRELEGCLSFPGVQEPIERSAEITVTAKDENGEEFSLSCDGLMAIAVQHEHNHLDGVLMTDLVKPLARRMIDKKMRKQNKRLQRVVNVPV